MKMVTGSVCCSSSVSLLCRKPVVVNIPDWKLWDRTELSVRCLLLPAFHRHHFDMITPRSGIGEAWDVQEPLETFRSFTGCSGRVRVFWEVRVGRCPDNGISCCRCQLSFPDFTSCCWASENSPTTHSGLFLVLPYQWTFNSLYLFLIGYSLASDSSGHCFLLQKFCGSSGE